MTMGLLSTEERGVCVLDGALRKFRQAKEAKEAKEEKGGGGGGGGGEGEGGGGGGGGGEVALHAQVAVCVARWDRDGLDYW